MLASGPPVESWLGELYTAHFPAVFRLCRKLLWDREDAADATHDVFARAAYLEGPVGTDDHSRAWLLTVARNRCIDLLRRRARLDRAIVRAGIETDAGPDPERVSLDRQLVRQVLHELSPRERRLLWLSAVESRPLREIAPGLRLTQVAAAQALHRARRRAGAIAARVAAAIGILPLRRANGVELSLREALPLALVPLLALSMHSSIAATPHRTPPPTVAGRPSPPEPAFAAEASSSGLAPSSSTRLRSLPASPPAPGTGPAVSVAVSLVQETTSRDVARATGKLLVIVAAIDGTVPPLSVQTALPAPTVQPPQ